MRRPAGAIGRAKPFRHDAFTAKRAGVFEDDGTVNDVVRIEHHAGMPVANEPQQCALAALDGHRAQIFAIKLDQIKAHSVTIWPRRWWCSRSNTDSPFSSQAIASPSTTHERTGSAAIAAVIRGKREAKLFPARVTSCTRSPLRCAMIRKPSCLISFRTRPAAPLLAAGGRAHMGEGGTARPERGAATHSLLTSQKKISAWPCKCESALEDRRFQHGARSRLFGLCRDDIPITFCRNFSSLCGQLRCDIRYLWRRSGLAPAAVDPAHSW
jgi:hypothetical protein